MNIYDDAIRLIRKRTPSANNSLLIKTLQTAKALQVEHEALKRDVARYFELAPKFKSITKEKQIECYQLQEKLSKVGKEE